MTFTCIYFLQPHCCSDAHSQDVGGGVQQGFIIAGLAEQQAGMMEVMNSYKPKHRLGKSTEA